MIPAQLLAPLGIEKKRAIELLNRVVFSAASDEKMFPVELAKDLDEIVEDDCEAFFLGFAAGIIASDVQLLSDMQECLKRAAGTYHALQLAKKILENDGDKEDPDRPDKDASAQA